MKLYFEDYDTYQGQVSGDKLVDNAFDSAYKAKKKYNDLKDNFYNYIIPSIAKKLGFIKTIRGRISDSQYALIEKEKEYKAAYRKMNNAMYDWANACHNLKKLYKEYRDRGGKFIPDYYSMSTEWDDND